MLSLHLANLFFGFLLSGFSILVSADSVLHGSPSTKLIHQYKPVTWVENIAVRPNGFLLPIKTTSSVLTQLDPHQDKVQEIYDFKAAGNAIQGITAVIPDVFVVDVLTCNISALTCVQGSVSTWRIDFRTSSLSRRNGKGLACVDEIAKFPDAGFLNGMAALNERTVLLADSYLGGIWSLDIWSGVNELVFTDQSMKGTSEIATGINGIRVRPGELFFTNSARGSFSRIPIDMKTGQKTANAMEIASGLSGPDDFEVDVANGVAYLANGAANQLLQIQLDGGRQRVVAKIPGPTSARWSSQERQGSAPLYISTIGGLSQYVEGNVTRGGAIYQYRKQP